MQVFSCINKTRRGEKGTKNTYVNVAFTDGEAELSSNAWCSAAEFPYTGQVVDITRL